MRIRTPIKHGLRGHDDLALAMGMDTKTISDTANRRNGSGDKMNDKRLTENAHTELMGARALLDRAVSFIITGRMHWAVEDIDSAAEKTRTAKALLGRLGEDGNN